MLARSSRSPISPSKPTSIATTTRCSIRTHHTTTTTTTTHLAHVLYLTLHTLHHSTRHTIQRTSPFNTPHRSTHLTMPIATPEPTCRGFILAHQHPNAPADLKIDPYAIVPCPHPPTIPTTLSASCAQSIKKSACEKLTYCEMHHCGACKIATKAARGNKAQVAASLPVEQNVDEVRADKAVAT